MEQHAQMLVQCDTLMEQMKAKKSLEQTLANPPPSVKQLGKKGARPAAVSGANSSANGSGAASGARAALAELKAVLECEDSELTDAQVLGRFREYFKCAYHGTQSLDLRIPVNYRALAAAFREL